MRKWYSAKRRHPRPARALRGSFEDEGKYYHCQHCGFICNIERDELGGPSDRDGLSYENYSDIVDESPLGNGLALFESAIEHFQTVLELGADGLPKVVKENWRAVVNSGCPLCGSRNWRGDY